MKRIRFWAASALLLIALSSLFILSASAEEQIVGGDCGEDVYWSLDLSTGELVIHGEGDMKDYGGSGGSTPWYTHRNSVRSVTVWEGVTALGNYAFYNCINLTEVNLPQGITEIPPSAFAGCSKLNELVLPATVTAIGSSAFHRCSSLSYIGLPEGLESIGNSAFANCVALTEITLPTGVTSIGMQAFYGCNRLTTISLPNTLTRVGNSVFTGTSLSKVLFYGSPEEWAAIEMGTGNTLLTDTLVIHPDHVFDREITAYEYLMSGADCENPEIYYKSCACGEMGEETFTYGEALGHTGGTATCLERAVCSICWEIYGELGEHAPDGEPNCLTDVYCTVCEELLTAALGHEYGEEIIPPTCTEKGYTLHACIRCDDSYTDTFTDPTGHTHGDPATCTEDQTCTACGEVLATALGHDYRSVVTLAPTCTEQGTMTDTCARCQDVRTRPVDPNGHTPGSEATCTEAQLCTVCHQCLTEKLGHYYGSETVDPTCTDRGYNLHTCSRCDISYLDTFVPAKGHTPGAAATCTQPQLCTVCSAVVREAISHSFSGTTVAPTCLGEGYSLHTCTHCSFSYTDNTVPALGHRAGAAATCTAPQTCTRCSSVMAQALGHDYDDETVAPTCEAQGYTKHTCSRCSSTYTDTLLPAKGHTPGTAATCTEPQLCAVCSTVVSPKQAHNYKDTSVASTCLEKGYTLHTCSYCSHSYADDFLPLAEHTPGAAATCTQPQLCAVCSTVISPKQAHTYEDSVVDATCLEQGYILHTCTLCAFSYIDGITPALGHRGDAKATCTDPETCVRCHARMADKLGHEYQETVIPPTCTEIGFTLYGCTRCSHSYADAVVAPLGHTAGDWITDRTPSFGEPGRRHTECTVCGVLMDRESFTDETEAVTESPSGETDSLPATSAEETTANSPSGGCGHTIGNILVISIVLIAVFLFWFIDSRRRHR